MATVYSTQFLCASVAGTGAYVTFYTVPVGYVLVLRDVECLPRQNGFAFTLRANGVSNFHYHASSVALVPAPWAGRVVLTAGQVLEHNVSTGLTVDFIASGYLLSA